MCDFAMKCVLTPNGAAHAESGQNCIKLLSAGFILERLVSLENILVDLKEPESAELKSVPPQIPPGACECGLIWKQGLCGYNQIQMWSYRIRLGPTSNMAGVLIRRGKSEYRRTQRCPVTTMRAEVGGMCLQAQGSQGLQGRTLP